ncbi:hypothetical protein CDHC01_2073 [Corynebacterium diphtheriae HC01]|nr:hypothetical protein [Corynebacterium diphtheriae]AEX45124.1 hypothetical protein CD241_2072 [Corynebacterium diphtheriae 241]AEX47335.1 hypothetical protein CDB402_2046 [Corynebacterium diphtheriae INCA 402]AEX75314.1 hypothetical protein CDHC01_2073 [Corynebacterium diphtheriae HC01]MBG9221555.1 hypothetical protein [Corynebacterium diphtheriae bv. mitis]MBG9300856.1 hypothetical protein [Corynebacterium diphtheriae bv. mitis]
MAQDTRVLGFVGKRVSKPSVQTKGLPCSPTEMPSAIPSAAPQNTVIVTVIEAEPIKPINEYPTRRQPKVFRDHVIRPTRLLDVVPERNTDAFANMAE